MLSKRRSFGARKVSPPQPTCMTDEQKATYLASLRTNRPARPTGSRPLPSKPPTKTNGLEHKQEEVPPRTGSALSFRQDDDKEEPSVNKRFSIPHAASLGNLKGRPLVMAPNGMPVGRKVTPPESTYHESLARQRERQEAHSLRQALQEIDHDDDESRLYSAAQKEAADLVWRHRNPQQAEVEKTAPYRNPDLPVPKKRYVIENRGSALDQTKDKQYNRSVSGASNSSREDKKEPQQLSKRSSRDNMNDQTMIQAMHSSRRKSSANRKSSSGSSKGVFRNPEHQIYEEPESLETTAKEVQQEAPLRTRTKNPFLRGARPLPEKPHTVPLPERTRTNRVEIYKNLPTQSRDAEYLVNSSSRSESPERPETPKGRAMEIRSDEIRAATSMKRSDRSPKLPTPTAVSDKLGRPIVSFDPAWKPTQQDSSKAVRDTERPSPRPMPTAPAVTASATASAPVIPTICLPEDEIPATVQNVPRISLPDDQPTVPTICLPEDEPKQTSQTHVVSDPAGRALSSSRPLPSTDTQSNNRPHHRPLPSHTQSSPSRLPASSLAGPDNRPSWLSRSPTPSVAGGIRGATATCTACSLPISGRIVTASGSSSSSTKVRFHPECFSCHHCGTRLECVSFYPEPDASRLERLGLSDGGKDGKTNHDQRTPAVDHGDIDVRFYCHLDYHDLFSPRCGSCHTPIEGAVILAAGKAWHEGHFFCAECGDPFSSSSPFVESKGYAYCVGCHTKRTSARCRSCQKQILDEVSVEALGGKWHEECFRCDECGGDFGDNGRFFVREVDVELTEKEKRRRMVTGLKDHKKTEERAVCEGCEGRRLRSRDVAAFL